MFALKNAMRLACMICLLGLFPVIAAAETIADEIAERYALTQTIRFAWYRKKFGQLDAIAADYRKNNTRTKAGYSKLGFFYHAFETLEFPLPPSEYPTGSVWDKLDEWIKKSPASPTPVILKAMFLAQQSVERDYFKAHETVALKPWEPSREILASARELLENHRELSNNDPHWHLVYLRVLRRQNVPIEDMLIAHSAALSQHPAYLPMHEEMFEQVVTKWLPDHRRIAAFANTIYDRTKESSGASLYARLYQYVYPILSGHQPYSLTGIDWTRMKAGYERIIEDFPKSWNFNSYAYFACLANDLGAMRKIFPKVRKKVDREVWKSHVMYKQCEAWAPT